MDCVIDWFKCELDFIRVRWGGSIDGVVTRTRARRASFLQGIKFDSDSLLDFSLPLATFASSRQLPRKNLFRIAIQTSDRYTLRHWNINSSYIFYVPNISCKIFCTYKSLIIYTNIHKHRYIYEYILLIYFNKTIYFINYSSNCSH